MRPAPIGNPVHHTAERQLAIRDLQHAESLLHLPTRAELTRENTVWIASARSNILAALKLLLELPGLPETRTSASELILKAEQALAAVDAAGADLSVRIADGLLVRKPRPHRGIRRKVLDLKVEPWVKRLQRARCARARNASAPSFPSPSSALA